MSVHKIISWARLAPGVRVQSHGRGQLLLPLAQPGFPGLAIKINSSVNLYKHRLTLERLSISLWFFILFFIFFYQHLVFLKEIFFVSTHSIANIEKVI
jgi:hypothetical protein